MSDEFYDAGDGVDFANDVGAKIPEVLPKPFKWDVLVMPVQPKPMSKGGLALPQEVMDNQSHLQVIGRIVAVGPLAFKSFKLCAGIPDILRVLFGFRIAGAPKVGDWVMYGRYTGMRFEFNGTRLVLMNDDTLLADPVEPQNVRVYV